MSLTRQQIEEFRRAIKGAFDLTVDPRDLATGDQVDVHEPVDMLCDLALTALEAQGDRPQPMEGETVTVPKAVIEEYREHSKALQRVGAELERSHYVTAETIWVIHNALGFDGDYKHAQPPTEGGS